MILGCAVAAADWMTGVSVAADAAAAEEEDADIVLSVDAQVVVGCDTERYESNGVLELCSSQVDQ